MPCIKHDCAERYVATGHCIICAREIRDGVRGGAPVKPRLDRKLRRTVTRTPLVRTRMGRMNFEGMEVS
jgi:hypothetical protein